MTISLVFCGACAKATYISTGNTYPARAEDCPIEIYTTKLPTRAYDEIGIVEGAGSWPMESLESILPKLKQQACAAGGDALIMTANQRGQNSEHSVTATVVRWIDED